MVVEIRGKRTRFNVEAIKGISFNEFKEWCYTISTFAQLPIKERDIQIKKAYGELTANAKKGPSVKHGSDLHTNDVKPNGGNSISEPGANDAGEDIEGEEDQAKVRKPKLLKEKKEAKL